MPPNELVELAEWDWVTDGKSRCLHHLASIEGTVADWDDCAGGPGVASCGRVGEWWTIPGLFTRMGANRCRSCCKAVGYPWGKGSPKNDDACRPLVEARLADVAAQELFRYIGWAGEGAS